MGENPSARLCCFPRLEKQDIIGCSRTFALLLPAIAVLLQLYLVSPVLFSTLRFNTDNFHVWVFT